MQRCVKISKQSVKNFRRFKILNKRTFTFLFIYRKIELSSAHNFHLHDENSANKKRDKTTHLKAFASTSSVNPL